MFYIYIYQITMHSYKSTCNKYLIQMLFVKSLVSNINSMEFFEETPSLSKSMERILFGICMVLLSQGAER